VADDTGGEPQAGAGETKRPWSPRAWARSALVALALAATVAVAVPSCEVVPDESRQLPLRPAGWHTQASRLAAPHTAGDLTQLFPVGRDPNFASSGVGPLTGAPGDLAGPDYQFRLVGSWTTPRLDTVNQFLGWRNLEDAAAPDGYEVLVAAMSWRTPSDPHDYEKPRRLSSDAVSVVSQGTRFTVEVPDGGDAIETIVRKGSQVYLEVHDRGHTNRLDLRTGKATGDLPQRVAVRRASLDLDLPFQGTVGSRQIPAECRLSGHLSGHATVVFQPSSAVAPGPPGRASVFVGLTVVSSTSDKKLGIKGRLDCGRGYVRGRLIPNFASGLLTLDLAQAFSLRDADGTITHAQLGDGVKLPIVGQAVNYLGAGVGRYSVGAIFDVPDKTIPPTLVFTPAFTVSGNVVDWRRRGKVPLEQWVPKSPPAEVPLTFR
jgi:hypothetical protein